MDADEVSITDTALRRIRPLHVVKDPKAPGGQRASSAAFDDDPDGSSMSVYMQSIVFKGSLTLGDVVYGKPSRWAVAATPVEKLIAEDQRIELDPIRDPPAPHPCDQAHALVHGDKSEKKRRERIAAGSPLVHIVD